VELAINPLFLLVCLAYLYLDPVETLAVILALLLHEGGHLLASLLCGLRLLRVELFPFGGQIFTDSMVGDTPLRDVLVALTGPAVSLSSAGLTYIMKGNLEMPGFPFFLGYSLLLGLFNLLPALPLDGGRVFKALLSMRLGWRKATVVASWSGLVLAVGICIIGLYLGLKDFQALNLLLIGGFLGYKAREELLHLPYGLTRYLLRKRLMLAESGIAPGVLVVAQSGVKVSRILNRNLPETLMVVLVLDPAGKVLGILSERVLIEAVLEQGPLITLQELLAESGEDDGV